MTAPWISSSCPVHTLTSAIRSAVCGAGGSNCQVPDEGAGTGLTGADGAGVPGDAAGWLAAVPWGAPVLGAMVPQAAAASATVTPKITEVSAGAKPARAERIVDHFFVALPQGHTAARQGGAAAVGAPDGPTFTLAPALPVPQGRTAQRAGTFAR